MKKLWQKYEFIVAFLIIATCELFFFRNVIGGQFSFAFNDELIDPLLNNFFLEHWFKLCNDLSLYAWNDLGIFYPFANTLSLSDTLLILAPPYILLRWVGADMFTACIWTVVAVHFLGSFTTYWAMRRWGKFSLEATILAVMLSSYSCTYATLFGIGCLQSVTLSFLPLWAVCLLIFSRSLPIDHLDSPQWRQKRILSASALIILAGLLLYSSFYTGFYLALWMIIWWPLFWLLNYLLGRGPKWPIPRLKAWGGEALYYLGLLFMSLMPTASLYLPLYRQEGGRSWSELLPFLPLAKDITLVNVRHLLQGLSTWQYIIQHHQEFKHFITGGPAITLSLLSLVTIWQIAYLIKRRLVKKRASSRQILTLSLSLAVMILIIAQLRFDNISLWWLIYKIVPGGGAIRNITRLNAYLMLPFALSLAFIWQVAQGYCRWLKPKRPTFAKSLNWLMLALIVILFADHSLYGSFECLWNLETDRRLLREVAPPPSQSRCFFSIYSKPPIRVAQELWNVKNKQMLNTMLISSKYNLPTLDGYSGKWPINYLPCDIANKNYLSCIYNWCITNNLDTKGLFAWDAATNKWLDYSNIYQQKHYYWFDSPYFTKLFPNPGCREESQSIVIEPQGSLSGPWTTVLPGKYRAEITGLNLNLGQIKVLGNDEAGNWQAIKAKYLLDSPNKTVIQLEVSQKYHLFMLSLTNNTPKEISFSCLSWQKVE